MKEYEKVALTYIEEPFFFQYAYKKNVNSKVTFLKRRKTANYML